MAQAAEIIDLNSFRELRKGVRQEPDAAPGPNYSPALAMPVMWMPVWVFVPVWPATA
jgi:hypothetical protein